jgi:polyisoprenoid-binding protein YceI
MKTTIKSLFLIALVVFTSAFVNPVKERKDVKESSITWTGKKILGTHTGTIDLKEGHLIMEGNDIVGGRFIVDMTTITNSDMDGKGKTKLEGHLKSDDFFGVSSHPTAILTIESATKEGSNYEVMGTMAIKGQVQPIEFSIAMGKSGARASLKIDRTLYGIKYGSGSFTDDLADNTISDFFELDVILKF